MDENEMDIQSQEKNERAGGSPAPQRPQSAFRRYRLGWTLLSMALTAVVVLVVNGGWISTFASVKGVASLILFPLIVGALLFRSALIADYRKRQAEEEKSQ